MNRTSNWSRIFLFEHAASWRGEDTPCRKTKKPDAMPFQAARSFDWSSCPAPFKKRFLIRFCSSPEPDTNSGMFFFTHDHVSLTGTV